VIKDIEMDQKERILIVDDDESTRKSLALILRKNGYKTDLAATGKEATEKLHERFFIVALVDIRLPDVEGTELLATLKTMCPDMNVIVVTGHASVENAVKALNKGMVGILVPGIGLPAEPL